jgi:hypothetical protein
LLSDADRWATPDASASSIREVVRPVQSQERNALQLVIRHDPTHIALMKQHPQGDKFDRLTEHLAFVAADILHPCTKITGPVELTEDEVRSRVLGGRAARRGADIKHACKAGWPVVRSRDADAAFIVEFMMNEKAKRTVLASAIGYYSPVLTAPMPTAGCSVK